MYNFRNWLLLKWDYLTTFLEENRQNIFYLFVFYVVTIGLFVERFAHYSFMSEHLDLRHIMGVGIAITRGSAAALSFCYSLLLLTMSRNLLTKLKVSSCVLYLCNMYDWMIDVKLIWRYFVLIVTLAPVTQSKRK